MFPHAQAVIEVGVVVVVSIRTLGTECRNAPIPSNYQR